MQKVSHTRQKKSNKKKNYREKSFYAYWYGRVNLFNLNFFKLEDSLDNSIDDYKELKVLAIRCPGYCRAQITNI